MKKQRLILLSIILCSVFIAACTEEDVAPKAGPGGNGIEEIIK